MLSRNNKKKYVEDLLFFIHHPFKKMAVLMTMNAHSTFTIVILWLLAKIPMAPTIVFVMKVLLAMAMTVLTLMNV